MANATSSGRRTRSKLVTENVTGASIACLQEQDLSDLKIAKPVSATWCPVRHFLLILFQKPFCNCLSAGLTSKGGKKAAAGAPRKKADDDGGVTGFNSLPKEEKDYLKLLYASHFPVETFPGATSVSEQDLFPYIQAGSKYLKETGAGAPRKKAESTAKQNYDRKRAKAIHEEIIKVNEGSLGFHCSCRSANGFDM